MSGQSDDTTFPVSPDGVVHPLLHEREAAESSAQEKGFPSTDAVSLPTGTISSPPVIQPQPGSIIGMSTGLISREDVMQRSPSDTGRYGQSLAGSSGNKQSNQNNTSVLSVEDVTKSGQDFAVASGENLRFVSDHYSPVQRSCSATPDRREETDYLKMHAAKAQEQKITTDDTGGHELCQMFMDLGISSGEKQTEHQRRTDRASCISKKNRPILRETEENSKPQVHTYTSRKEAAISFPGQMMNACNTGNVHVGGSSPRTSVSSGTQMDNDTADSTCTSHVQEMAPASEKNIGRAQGDIHDQISLRFYVADANYESGFPQKIEMAKWILLKNCKIERKFKQLDEDKGIVCIQENYGEGVVTVLNRRAMQADEAAVWVQESQETLSGLLENIQSVIFGCTGVNFQRLLTDMMSPELHYSTPFDGRWMRVSAINSETMDKFMEKALPVLKKMGDVNMMITIPVPFQTLKMLESLGFKHHYEQCVPNARLFIRCPTGECILHCNTDLRQSLETEIRNFTDNQHVLVLDVPDIYQRFIFDTSLFFQHEKIRDLQPCFFRRRQGHVEVLSSNKEGLSEVESIVKKNMTAYILAPHSKQEYEYCLTALANLSNTCLCFCYQLAGHGMDIEIVGWSQQLLDLLNSIFRVSGTHFSEMTASVRVKMVDKPTGQQDKSCSTDTSTEKGCSGNSEKSSREQKGTGNSFTEKQTDGKELKGHADQPSGEQLQSGVSDDPPKDPEGPCFKDRAQTEQIRGNSSITLSYSKEQMVDERSENMNTSGAPAPGGQQFDQSAKHEWDHAHETKPRQTENSDPDGQPHTRYDLAEDIAKLLQVENVRDKVKSHLADKDCIVNCQYISQGFFTIRRGEKKNVTDTLQELFHREVIDTGESDEDVEEALKSFCETHGGQVGHVNKNGKHYICVLAKIKDELCHELEKLKTSQCLVPLPLYAYEYLDLKCHDVETAMKKKVDGSVNIIPDRDNLLGVKLSAERKCMKKAVQRFEDFVLNLEVTEKRLDTEEALFFQDLKGQEWIKQTENEFSCRIDAVVDEDQSGLRATAPSGHQLLVSGDTVAATGCDCIVLPLCEGQAEWSPLQGWILRKSFLSETVAPYLERCRDGPVALKCNADFDGKMVIIVLVPADLGMATNKEKQRITEAYKEAFAMCGEHQHSVAVCAKQSPKISLRKSLKPLLFAILETFSSESPSLACKTVVIYTNSAQDCKQACQVVRDGLREKWHLKRERVLRSKPQREMIKVLIGEIQKTKADVIVNSTNTKLYPSNGAVEIAISRAAGENMLSSCQKLYPGGIRTNGLAVTDSFNMKNAEKIYHIALSDDHFQEDKREILLHDLHQVILRCLIKASWEKHTSIAFPTLGSGQLRYPCDDVARVMFSTIDSFFREMPHTTLQEVIIVVYPGNAPSIQALRMEEISHLYTCSLEKEQTGEKHKIIDEMQMTLGAHKIQIIHGNVFNKPWVSDACVHGKLASQRGESAPSDSGCHSIIVEPGKETKHVYQKCFTEAFKLGHIIQIAADTLRSDSLKDLVSALEKVLSHDRYPCKLVSVIFSDEEKAMKFHQLFKEVQGGRLNIDEAKLKKGQLCICSYRGGQTLLGKIEEMKVPDRFKKLMKSYREACPDQDPVPDDKKDDKESNKIKIGIPSHFLEKVDLSQVLEALEFDKTEEGSTTNITIKADDLVNTSRALDVCIQSSIHENQAGESTNMRSTDEWGRIIDELELKALRFLLGEEFDQTFDAEKQDKGNYKITFKGASSKSLETQVDSLRQEDVQLTAEEVSKLGDTVDVKSSGINAFVQTMPMHDKATIFALDYDAMNKAKHLLTIKVGRKKVTSRSRRRFDTGNPNQLEQTPPHSLEVSGPGMGPDVSTADFTTQSGIKVMVYKTDITKLPVDAIVNAANEHLNHGGGVAYAIAKAAGFAMEAEGTQHITKNGPLQVTDVVETTAGSLPCKKVLHAVGPRWSSYTNKAQCRQHLVDTVFNCLQKADSLGFGSIALPSISAAIFGVPQNVCAESYLAAVKKFDDLHGKATSVREIHFVDITDAMVFTIQNTFSTRWSENGSSPSGSQGVETSAGGRSKDEESTPSVQNPAEENLRKPLDTQPRAGSSVWKVEIQEQSPRGAGQPQDDPIGFPCLKEVGVGSECQAQVTFKGLNLTVIFQRQSVVDMQTESVILWQEEENFMKDKTWKKIKEKLSPQASRKADELKRKRSAAGKEVCLQTSNKLFVFAVLPSDSSPGEEKIRETVEQAFNKVVAEGKKTVAVSVWQKEGKGKSSNKDTDDIQTFAKGLYRAVMSYTRRSSSSITEIHVAELDAGILNSMVESVNMQIGIDRSLLDQTKSQPPSMSANHENDPARTVDVCCACKNKRMEAKRLSCGHFICGPCFNQRGQSSLCPVCNLDQDIMFGDQPEGGKMKMMYSSFLQCEGCPKGTYTVEYSFPGGRLTEKSPYPGKRYHEARHTCYLPNTPEGRKVLMLFKIAFDRRLIFKFYFSTTTDVARIIWSDIHHKTCRSFGGRERYGYPDPDYLTRVLRELAGKRVTEKDLTSTQRDFIQNPEKFLPSSSYQDFSYHFNG